MRLRVTLTVLLLALFAGCGEPAPEAGALPKKPAAIFWGVEGFPQKLIEDKVPAAVDASGFTISDAHKRINDAYVKRYGSTTLDTLNFVGVGNEKALYHVINQHPKSAAFIPLTLFSYKTKGVDSSWVGMLAPEYMADAVGLEDPKLREEWMSAFGDLQQTVKTTLKPTMEETATYTQMPAEPVYEITYPVKGDIGEFVETFQEKFEEAFEEDEFIIAGYRDIKDNMEMLGLKNNFDSFVSYSICHFGFSNRFFNEIPRAGIFAPCSVYMYIPKGSKTMHVGFPTLSNWVNVMQVKDPELMEMVREFHEKVTGLLESLGGQKVLMTKYSEVKERKPLKLAKEMVNTSYTVQDVDSSLVKKRLKRAGFKILGEHFVAQDAALKTILYTNSRLIRAGAKTDRGFAAVMRVMVDDGRREAIFVNPEYQLRAFMQKSYDSGLAKSVANSLRYAFKNLQVTIPDMLERKALADYHFMVGMPRYGEMAVVAEGRTETLLKNFIKNSADKIIFDLKLSRSSYLFGVNLDRKIEKFVYKTGTDQAALLPYMVLIEKGKAKILAPKYYIALMYPSLTLAEFLRIAHIPGNIEKQIKKMFN